MAERKKIKPRKTLSPSAQEKALEMLKQQDVEQNTTPIARNTVVGNPSTKPAAKKVKSKTQRVTVDFPQDLYEEMKTATQLNGQTLKGFIVSMVRKHLREQS